MISGKTVPMVDFLEHFVSPYHHHSQLAQVICLASVSIHQQRDSHQKISPIMDEDDIIKKNPTM